MQFFKPEAFIYLWVLPLLAAVFWLSAVLWKQRVARFADPVTVQSKLLPHLRRHFLRTRFLLLAMVFILSITALARPQWGEAKKKVERKGVDIIFMLDTSLSMLAEDNKPNRLKKAKIEIKNFVHSLKGDRIGMVAFAGSSFLQAPLTLDYSAFFLFLDAVDVGYIPDPGTSLLNAVELGIKSFPDQDVKHKAIILFTDGEDHSGGELSSMIDMAKEKNVRIYTVGMGSEEGEPIPLKDQYGRQMGYKKDRAGQVVITKINKKNLEMLASETGGVFFQSTPSEQEVQLIIKHLSTLGKRQFKERIVTEREDHFQVFLIFGFLLLLLEMLVQRHAKKRLIQVMGLLLCFFCFTGFIDTTSSLNEKANELYEQKKYDSALENYRKAQVKSPDNPNVLYNLATALYQTQQYQEAKKHYETVIQKAEDVQLKEQALYNYGNTLYRLGEFDKAIKAYEEALELVPEDEDAKYNLEFLQKTKNKFEKENQNQQQENQNQQDQKQQQQDQNQQNQQQQQQQKQDQNQQNQNQQDQQQQQNQNQQNQQNQQQNQDQQQDQQDQKGGGEQDQEQEQKPEDEQGEQEKEQQDQQQDQQEQEGGDQEKEQDKPESSPEGDQQDEQQEPQNEEGDQEAPARPEEEQGEDEQPAQPDQGPERPQPMPEQRGPQDAPQPSGEGGRAPLQGQMTMDNALRILDALKDSEKDLQDLRRPAPDKNPAVVLKDW